MGDIAEPFATATAEKLTEELAHPEPGAIRSRALEIFGDKAKANSWMHRPNSLFDGQTPEELLQTGNPDEMRRVLTILIRIDYGVFS